MDGSGPKLLSLFPQGQLSKSNILDNITIKWRWGFQKFTYFEHMCIWYLLHINFCCVVVFSINYDYILKECFLLDNWNFLKIFTEQTKEKTQTSHHNKPCSHSSWITCEKCYPHSCTDVRSYAENCHNCSAYSHYVSPPAFNKQDHTSWSTPCCNLHLNKAHSPSPTSPSTYRRREQEEVRGSGQLLTTQVTSPPTSQETSQTIAFMWKPSQKWWVLSVWCL